MSEDPQVAEAVAKPKRGILTWALWGVTIFGVAGFLYIMLQSSTKTAPSAPEASAACLSCSAWSSRLRKTRIAFSRFWI